MTTTPHSPTSPGFFQLHPAHATLAEIPLACWQELQSAAGNPSHSWSRVTLATLSTSGPEQRILILRRATDDHRLHLYTDDRTAKVEQIQRDSRVSGLCYSPEHRVQLTFNANAEVVTDSQAIEAHWNSTPIDSRRNYMGVEPPGTFTPVPSVNLPADLPHSHLTVEQTSSGLRHFAVLEMKLLSLELLWLRPEGNYRAVLTPRDGEFESHWIQP